MTPATHYQHSGKAPIGGILTTLVGGLMAGAALGAVYGFLIYWCPFVYINFFITLGFGVFLALAVGQIAKLGKIRNFAVVSVIALVVALASYLVHWSVWIRLVSEIQLTSPSEIWTVLTFVNAMGAWSIFGWTPTGFALWAIWGIEAAMIIGMGVLVANAAIDHPFCEATGQWATENTLANTFALSDEAAQAASPSSLLSALKPAEDGASAYAEVRVASVEGSDLRCVSLDGVVVETDKDGKEQKKTTKLIRNMLFDRDSFDRLLKLDAPIAS